MDELLVTIATATRTGSLAVTRGEQLLGEMLLDPPGTQSDILLPSLEHLLQGLGLEMNEIDAFAAVTGPGAFTGLRVGVATVKGLSLATGRPTIGISSLQALAAQVPEAAGPVCAMLDARKGEVYAGLYTWEGGMPFLLDRERVLDPADIREVVSGDAIFVGDGSVAYRTLIVRQLASRARFAPWTANVLRASSAAMLALERFRAGETLIPEHLNPVYIRPSDAELNSRVAGSEGGIEG